MKSDYLADVRQQFEMYRGLAEKAMARLNDSQFFEMVGDDSNSVAHIVKHLAGNLRSRWTDFLHTDGEKPDRRRDTEFEIAAEDTRESLMERWDRGWSLLSSALDTAEEADLAGRITIRWQPYTILQAINRQLTHYAYHVGQIVFIARIFAGREWQSLSVPRGESEQFNARMRKKFDAER